MPDIFLQSNNQTGSEWLLLTPLEWAVSGLNIEFKEGETRKTDSQIEDLIEENWEKRQKGRQEAGFSREEAWPKVGYRGHHLDLESRTAVIESSPADWKALTGTNYNPQFYELMRSRFESASRTSLSPQQMHTDARFQEFIRPYLDNSLAQTAAVFTRSGIPIGLRSRAVGVSAGQWHVPGGWLPAVGQAIYHRSVPIRNENPIVPQEIFLQNEDCLKANAYCNLYDESAGRLTPQNATITYAGLVYEIPEHKVQLISIVNANIDSFGKDWEHDRIQHHSLDEVPGFLNETPNIVPAGQANLVVAYLASKGIESKDRFSFIR